ncbi:hypothetical protein H5T52_04385 [Candidatus Bipolaricaulota bacterium]|nr:hypothetical protein [Candidatus Bipolaricaulota bacterium]
MKAKAERFLWTVLLGFLSFPVWASPVELTCLSPERTVAPRSVVTFSLRITNLGASPDTYDISFELPEGFFVLFSPGTVELGPGESKVFLVSLLASALAPAGSYEIEVRAQSQKEPNDFAVAVARVAVLPHAGVELRLPAGGLGWPGSTVIYTLWVVNRGNDLDSFSLEVTSSWRWEISPRVVHLLPGETAEVTLVLTVPATAKPGDKDYCWVTVRSLADPEVKDSGGIWTTVTLPPPEQVPVTLFPIVPARLTWTGRFEDDFSSKLSLTMGGTIAPGRYLAVSGDLELSAVGKELKGGWIEYRERDWEGRLGQLFYYTPVTDISGVGLRYSYHPSSCLYQATFYLYNTNSLFHFRLGQAPMVLDLYSKLTDDFTLLANLKTDNTALRLEIGNSGSATISTHGSPALSGSLSWGSGVTVGLSGSLPPLSGRFSYTKDDTYTRILGGLGFTAPLIRTVNVRLAGEAESERDEDPGSPLDTLQTKLCLSLYDRSRPLSWSLSTEFWSSSDKVANVSAYTLTIKGSLTYWPSPDFSVGLESEIYGWSSGSVNSELALTSAFPLLGGLKGELRWTLVSQEEFQLSLRSADLTLSFTKKKGLWEFGAEARFQAPLPLVETMGQVEGVIFVDTNMNGIPDPGEQGLSGVLLQLGKEQAVTGAGGVFRFYPMLPGTYRLRILTPLSNYCPQPRLPLGVQVSAGKVETVKIGLIPAATVSGRVFIYRPKNNSALNHLNGNSWVVDRPLSGARVILTSGHERRTTLTDYQGSFFFQGLCPGTWELRVELPPLAPPHYVEQEVYVLKLEPGERLNVEIRVLPKEREIRPLGEIQPPPVSVVSPP